MKNENSLYTVSMLSALLEKNGGDYLSLLSPFVLNCLPRQVNSAISIENVTEKMRSFGFKDFPHKTTEKILKRLCQKNGAGVVYVATIQAQRKKMGYKVLTTYDSSEFERSQSEMRHKIDAILKEIQTYFETHFYHKRLKIEDIRDKLIAFFEVNSLSIIQNVEELKMLPKEKGSAAFEIAHFVIDEHEKNSLIYADLCDVIKGFLTYKAIYYFANDHKNGMESKFQDVTFYLDCSLVIDALGFDTPEDQKSIHELISLVRRNGGKVAVFNHTVEEAARLIESFAAKPQFRNSFRLEGLAKMNLPKDTILAMAGQLSNILKKKEQIDSVEAPSLLRNVSSTRLLSETDIVDWLKQNRIKPKSVTNGDEERYQFDAKSLMSIEILRKNNHPHYIEQAKAMIVTQDPWLNRCLRELCGNYFKSEVLYSIEDIDLVSLMWLRDYKEGSTIPSDLLIANAHAACRATDEVITRAIEIAHKMVESGTLELDAAYLVSAQSDFKSFLGELVRNDESKITERQIESAISAYIARKAEEKVASARNEERSVAEKVFDEQRSQYLKITDEQKIQLQEKDHQIEKLEKMLIEQRKKSKQEKSERAEKRAKKYAMCIYWVLKVILVLLGVALLAIFTTRCVQEYLEGNTWWPYLILDILGFLGIPPFLFAKDSFCCKWQCRVRDGIYARLYSRFLEKG